MISSSCLNEACATLILDTSVVVNLNATGYSERILSSLPINVHIPKPVILELERGILAGHSDATDLRVLLDKGIVRELPIPAAANGEFVALVSGASVTSLGDGEAATIACSYATGAWAAIDERKARRICSERYQTLNLVSTVDILSHAQVVAAFTPDEMSAVLFAALEVAHMHVQPHHMDWVVSHIDDDKLDLCVSLPQSVREGTQQIARKA